jgi:hypothetical protein
MTRRPLIAVEDPPDFGTERTNRYRKPCLPQQGP